MCVQAVLACWANHNHLRPCATTLIPRINYKGCNLSAVIHTLHTTQQSLFILYHYIVDLERSHKGNQI